VTLFLCGDVMTGRGVDQILPRPGDPRLWERYVEDARDYVSLAEAKHGAIRAPVAPTYIWGEALSEWDRVRPDARIVNLETAVTARGEPWPAKGIHYRMHPGNIDCLSLAKPDVCVLANNHVLDFGWTGLEDTLDTLAAAGMAAAGAGRTLAEARAPAVVPLAGGSHVLVTAAATATSGVSDAWAAGHDRAGVDVLPDLSRATAREVAARARRVSRPGDFLVASIHWGTNWGYDVPADHVRFARWLIDDGVHIVHGHSSHHPRPIEVYRDGLILYGCGDFLNDYEGIEGAEAYRGDLALMYFATLSPDGALVSLEMTPLQIRQMRLARPKTVDVEWLRVTLDRVSAPCGARVEATPAGAFVLRWKGAGPHA
jgi:poly-gamma-glutamate synthesis protein (capsule biosynthesis protein)